MSNADEIAKLAARRKWDVPTEGEIDAERTELLSRSRIPAHAVGAAIPMSALSPIAATSLSAVSPALQQARPRRIVLGCGAGLVIVVAVVLAITLFGLKSSRASYAPQRAVAANPGCRGDAEGSHFLFVRAEGTCNLKGQNFDLYTFESARARTQHLAAGSDLGGLDTATTPKCPPANGSPKRVLLFKSAPPPCIPRTSVWELTFKTSLGNIVVRMPATSSYAAVNNFVFLSRYHYYDKTTFHRVIPGFVVQGGDPWGDGTGGPKHYPGYSFTGNTPPASCKTKPSQAGCYQTGDIAMANSTGPSTNGSQFFFVLAGGAKVLDQEPYYTIFGKVIRGVSVMDKIGVDGSPSGTPAIKVHLLTVTVKQVSG